MTKNNTVSGIVNVKKSWFKAFEPFKFTLIDISDDEVFLSFDKYEEVHYKSEKVEKIITEYLNKNNILDFKRKELEEWLNEEYGNDAITKSAITVALNSMQDKHKLIAEGETKNRHFTVIRE